MHYLPLVHAGGAAEDEPAFASFPINLETHRIPYLGDVLPFVDEAGLITFQDRGRIYLGYPPVRIVLPGIRKGEFALRKMSSTPCLSATFRTFHADCADRFQGIVDLLLYQPGAVILIAHVLRTQLV